MKIRKYLSMYLTDEKTKHSSWVGSYQTRKWNDVTSIIYFEKVYGGKSLLKKIKLEAEQKFNKFQNVSIYRIPEINTKQNLSILDRNLKNFRYYLNNNTDLQKKIFFIK